MNICILYYDGFAEFEVVLTSLLFMKKNVITTGLENRIYESEEKQRFLPHKTIGELNTDDIDLFIIPGGDPQYLYDNKVLKNFLRELNSKNKYIAGICGGTELLASAGLLENKKCTGDSSGLREDASYIHLFDKAIIVNEDIVVDGNIITSVGQAFIEFAFELGQILNIFKDKDEVQARYKWFKNIKNSK